MTKICSPLHLQMKQSKIFYTSVTKETKTCCTLCAYIAVEHFVKNRKKSFMRKQNLIRIN